MLKNKIKYFLKRHERQKRMSNCHRFGETKETRKLNTMWDYGLDLRIKKEL